MFLLGTCFFYIADVAVDIFTAVEHYLAWRRGNETAFAYFIATVVFIALPTVIINLLSLGLYTWGYVVFVNKRYRERLKCGADLCTKSYIPDDIVLLNARKSKKAKTPKLSQSLEQDSSLVGVTKELSLEAFELQNFDNMTNSQSHPPPPRHRTLSRDTSFSQCPPHYPNRKTTTLAPMLEEDDVSSDIEVPEIVDVGDEEVDSVPEFYPLDLFFTYEYLVVLLLHILQLGFIFRVVRLLYRRRKDAFSFDRYRDVSFLRLIESFLESAPQLLLQLYIVVLEDIPDPLRKGVTALAVVISMISLALAVADYISAGKDILHYDPPPNKTRQPRMSWFAYFIVILWQLAMIVSRGIAISLFASEYGNMVFIFGGLHYLIMVYWLYAQDAHVFKRNSSDYKIPGQHICDNYGVEFIAAAFNLFFLFRLEEGSSLKFNTAYYTLFFIENLLMILLWYVHIDYGLELWYEEAAPVTVVTTFLLGLSFLLLYYAWFQPTRPMSEERDFYLTHPTMTCTLNRLYRQKISEGDSVKQFLTYFCRKQ